MQISSHRAPDAPAERPSPYLIVWDGILAKALVHVERRLHDRIDSKALTRDVGLSLSHLRTRFRETMREPLSAHARRLRLERAAMALRFSRQSISDIALACGFDTHEGFTRAFRRAYGRSPLEYRNGGPIAAAVVLPSDLPVRLIERPTVRVAFVRCMGPRATLEIVWPRFFDLIARKGLWTPSARFLGIHYENAQVVLDPARMRYDAAITVGRDFAGDQDLAVQELPGGLDAVLVKTGTTAELEAAWRQLVEGWLLHGRYTWRDDRFFDIYSPVPGPFPPPGGFESLPRVISVELHVPVTVGRFAAEPTTAS